MKDHGTPEMHYISNFYMIFIVFGALLCPPIKEQYSALYHTRLEMLKKPGPAAHKKKYTHAGIGNVIRF